MRKLTKNKKQMKKNYIIFTLCLFLMGLSTTAQQRTINKASKTYTEYNYVDAKEVYLKVAERGYHSEELYTKLANIYYFNAQYDEALIWYQRVFDLVATPEEPVVLLRYSQTLKALGLQEEANLFFDKFIDETGIDMAKTTEVDYQQLIDINSGRYDVQALEGIYDKKKIAFGHTVADGKLIYASTDKDNPSFFNRRSGWDGLTFLSLHEVPLNEDQNQTNGKPEKLKDLKEKFHRSSAVITKDGNTMYFTGSNLDPKLKRNDENLKIYRAQKVSGKWQEPEALNFNSDLYSSAHPALSPDETKLYFASDRPGGMGQSDLYVASISESGTIGEPQNLGPKVNTPGKETFPFVSADNELYFSSDGHYGLGGLDVFYIKIEDNDLGHLHNVGAPINTYADDFAFGINAETKRGFVSSNRTENEGKFVYDNIYSFIENTPIQEAIIHGCVTDKDTGEPISEAIVTLYDPEDNVYKEITTGEEGCYETVVNRMLVYRIRAEKPEYNSDEKLSEKDRDKQEINFQLQKTEIPIVPGTDLAKVLNIPIIHFDFDKHNIRPDAEVELAKLIVVLEENPEIKINIRSHTDSRGSDTYNLALSQRRAKATYDYLTRKGIDHKRMTYEGLGEAELVNGCSDDINCTEAEHQVNRRSEFIVVE